MKNRNLLGLVVLILLYFSAFVGCEIETKDDLTIVFQNNSGEDITAIRVVNYNQSYVKSLSRLQEFCKKFQFLLFSR